MSNCECVTGDPETVAIPSQGPRLSLPPQTPSLSQLPRGTLGGCLSPAFFALTVFFLDTSNRVAHLRDAIVEPETRGTASENAHRRSRTLERPDNSPESRRFRVSCALAISTLNWSHASQLLRATAFWHAGRPRRVAWWHPKSA